MSGHTPGPWTLKVVHDKLIVCADSGCKTPWYLADIIPNVAANTLDDQESNARLIAAAPDLLEACLLARHICEEGNALQQQLDAAIAKATQP